MLLRIRTSAPGTNSYWLREIKSIYYLKSKSVHTVSLCLPLNSSDNDSENSIASSSRRNSGEQDECLRQNGILEPWKLTTTSQEQIQKNFWKKITRSTYSSHKIHDIRKGYLFLPLF